jgi:hypothetical protein
MTKKQLEKNFESIIPVLDLGNHFKVDFKPLIRKELTNEQKELLTKEIEYVLSYNKLDEFCFVFGEFRRVQYTESMLLTAITLFFKQEQFAFSQEELIKLVTILYPQLLHTFRVLNPSHFDIEFSFDKPLSENNELKFWLYGKDTLTRDYGYVWWFEEQKTIGFKTYSRAYTLTNGYNYKDRTIRFFIDIDIF